MIGGDFIKNKKYKSIFFILILFLFVSLMGAASAVEDSTLNNTITTASGGGVLSVPMVESADVLSAQTYEISGNNLHDVKNNLNDSVDIISGDYKYLGKTEYNSNLTKFIPVEDYTFNVNSVERTSSILGADPDVISGDSFQDIQTAINNAEAESTIYLDGITYTQNTNNIIQISKPITIIGTGSTVLDAQRRSRIFTIAQQVTGVNIQGITFVNGNADNGGALYINGGCNNIVVTDCVFKDNTATANGGAIATSDGWTPSGLSVSECMFIDNSASNAIDIYATGSNNQVSDSSFTGKTDLTATKESLSLTLNLYSNLGNCIKGSISKSGLSYWDGSSKIPVEITDTTKINLAGKDITLEIYKLMVMVNILLTIQTFRLMNSHIRQLIWMEILQLQLEVLCMII